MESARIGARTTIINGNSNLRRFGPGRNSAAAVQRNIQNQAESIVRLVVVVQVETEALTLPVTKLPWSILESIPNAVSRGKSLGHNLRYFLVNVHCLALQ